MNKELKTALQNARQPHIAAGPAQEAVQTFIDKQALFILHFRWMSIS
jgi:hypothetical protein